MRGIRVIGNLERGARDVSSAEAVEKIWQDAAEQAERETNARERRAQRRPDEARRGGSTSP